MVLPILGIDVSKDKLDVVLIQAKTHLFECFENNESGLEEMNCWLAKKVERKVHACLEATGRFGTPAAKALHEQGHQVSIVNPARIKAYGRSQMARNKTDKMDAFVIASFCQTQSPRLWSPPDTAYTELQTLVRYRKQVMRSLEKERNRLRTGVGCQTVRQSVEEHVSYLVEKSQDLLAAIQSAIENNQKFIRDMQLLTSIPGIGEWSACKFLAEVEDIHAFESADQLAAYAGVSPRQYVSGSSVRGKPRFSKMGNSISVVHDSPSK